MHTALLAALVLGSGQADLASDPRLAAPITVRAEAEVVGTVVDGSGQAGPRFFAPNGEFCCTMNAA
ncbi:MAG: hypothetical protein IH851_13185 [Armatimonadetes bacterium]|nr:hypothetical protein [Armatimonadota bacterium]